MTFIDSDGKWHRASKGAPEEVRPSPTFSSWCAYFILWVCTFVMFLVFVTQTTETADSALGPQQGSNLCESPRSHRQVCRTRTSISSCRNAGKIISYTLSNAESCTRLHGNILQALTFNTWLTMLVVAKLPFPNSCDNAGRAGGLQRECWRSLGVPRTVATLWSSPSWQCRNYSSSTESWGECEDDYRFMTKCHKSGSRFLVFQSLACSSM